KHPANIKGKDNKLIKLKKGIWIDPKLIGFLGFSDNNKYYEKGVSLWVITFSFLIKIMIIGILGLTLYNTVSMIFSVSRQTSISYSDVFLNVIFSGFTFIAVIYYLSSLNKIEYQKFENYALFYCLLGIFTIIFLDLDINYIIFFVICEFLAFCGITLYMKNRELRREDTYINYIRINFLSASFLCFIFADMGSFILYLTFIEDMDFGSFESWLPLISFIFSFSAILYLLANLKIIFYDVEGYKTYKFAIIFIFGLISLILNVYTFMIIYPLIGSRAIILIIFSGGLFMMVGSLLNVKLMKNLRNLMNKFGVNIKKLSEMAKKYRKKREVD
ncbi:MAG: hypothetical protein ACTSRP_23770, partial [Candidatus Helarchaeota archaeon]